MSNKAYCLKNYGDLEDIISRSLSIILQNDDTQSHSIIVK